MAPDNTMQRTALRAAADAERWTATPVLVANDVNGQLGRSVVLARLVRMVR